MFLLGIKMSEKTLKFGNTRVNKNEFHKSKQPIGLDLVNVDRIVVPGKFKHIDDGFKHFIGYREAEIDKPLCIILPQMTGYIKYFGNGRKHMSFIIDDVLDKFNKEILSIKFHNMPVYDEKYIKVKVREFSAVIKRNFLSDEVPKENEHYTFIACITIDSVMRMEKKNYP